MEKEEAKPEAKLEAEPEAKSEAKLEAEPETKAEAKLEAELEAKAEAKLEAELEAKAEAKLEAEPEAKAEAKLEAEPEAKAEAKLEAEPEAKAEAKLEAEPEAKAEAKLEAKPEETPRVRLKRVKDTEGGPNAKNPKKEFELPQEVVQVFQALSSPKPNRFGQPTRTDLVYMEDGLPVLPEMNPLQQCQQLQQVQGMIQYHEQQVKYRSYMQLEVLRHIRKQLCDDMSPHPSREAHLGLFELAKQKKLHPISPAERASIDYFSALIDWTVEARHVLQDREPQFQLFLIGRQLTDWKIRINEIVTHEQYNLFMPYFAERIDSVREHINVLHSRSYVSLC